jgi:hypothetical protein
VGGLRLADRGQMPTSVLRRRRDLAVLRDRYRRTDDRTARDAGADGNQLGNQSGNHAADLREYTHLGLGPLATAQELGQGHEKVSELRKHLSARILVPALSSAGRADPAGAGATNMPLTWGYITKWSYGDSNSGPLACHAHSARHRRWLGVALHGDHLRLPWLDMAWHRLVPVHVGSPTGSQSSLAPLIF